MEYFTNSKSPGPLLALPQCLSIIGSASHNTLKSDSAFVIEDDGGTPLHRCVMFAVWFDPD